MKTLFLLTCLIIFSSCNKKTEFDCSSFKIGKFQQILKKKMLLYIQLEQKMVFNKIVVNLVFQNTN